MWWLSCSPKSLLWLMNGEETCQGTKVEARDLSESESEMTVACTRMVAVEVTNDWIQDTF